MTTLCQPLRSPLTHQSLTFYRLLYNKFTNIVNLPRGHNANTEVAGLLTRSCKHAFSTVVNGI
jgi:hypothetical protein